jgi:uncharacterized protein YegJ (DUF2314 family)
MGLALIALVIVVGAALAKVFFRYPRNPIFEVDAKDPEMRAAMMKARAEIEHFITVVQEGQDSMASVKVPISEKGRTEHFWINDLTYQKDEFSGLIDNDPQIVTSVCAGQRVKVNKADISDWLYFNSDGRMVGNYTLRVLLHRMPSEQAQDLKRELQWV